jgi:hypothetical protein
MNLFKKDKISVPKQLLSGLLVIEDEKLEIRYIDNSNLTPVQSGKIQELKGWYISKNGDNYSKTSTDNPVFKSLTTLFEFIGINYAKTK